MINWDKYPGLYQALLIGLSLLIIAISLANFFTISGKVSDDNLYRLPVPTFYVVNEAIGSRLQVNEEGDTLRVRDTIQPGSILYSLNDTILNDFSDYTKRLREAESGELKLKIENLKTFDDETWFVQFGKLPPNFIKYIPAAAVVISVEKEGASYSAGMRVGDLIIRANGRPFAGLDSVDLHLIGQEEGALVTYDVLRGKEEKQIKVRLSKFGIRIENIIYFSAGLLYLLAGLFVGIKRPKIKAARITSLGLILISLITIVGSITGLPETAGLLWYIRYSSLLLGYFIGIPVILHGSHYFPKEFPAIINRKWTITVPYIIGMLGILIALWDYFFQRGSWNFWIFIISITLIFVFYSVLRGWYKKERPQELTKTIKYIKWAVIITFGIQFIFIILSFLKIRPDVGFFPQLIVFLIPLAYIFTVARYRLLDIDFRIKRNVQYIFISVIWKITLVLLISLSIYAIINIDIPLPNLHFTGSTIVVLEKPLSTELNKYYSKLLAIIFAFILSILIWVINKEGQHFLDRKFNRVKFDYRSATEKLHEMMSTRMDIDGLAKGIVEKLGELIQLKRVGIIFFKEDNKISGQKYYGLNDRELKDFCVLVSDMLYSSISQFHNGFRVEYLPENIKEVYTQCRFQYVIPVRSKGNLIGAVIVGEKMSEAPFHTDDIDFLMNIASHASVAIENQYLYEGLARQERMRHELEIARQIQLASLPQEVPKIPGLDISGISIPALEVGGDFYDFLDGKENEITIVVGDVSGKGTSAALYMSKAQGILRTLYEFGLSPRELLIRTNRLIHKSLSKSSFITVIGTSFDTAKRKVKLARAGHVPLYIYRAASQQVEKIVPKGILLGMKSGSIFDDNLKEEILDYAAGDVFLLVTDGVLEARDKDNNEYAETRLMDIFRNKAFNNAEITRNVILNSVQEFSGGSEQFDDITVVVVKAV